MHALRHVVILMLATTVLGCPNPDAKYAASIRGVYREMSEAAIRCEEDLQALQEPTEGKSKASVSELRTRLVALCEELDAIDVTSCPPDFKQAHLALRSALRDSAIFTEQYEGFTGGVRALFQQEEGVKRRAAPVLRSLEEAKLECEAVALKYGVRVTRNRNDS